jgi:preprotein translocase SecE subunit
MEGGMAGRLQEAQHKGLFMAVAVNKESEIGAGGTGLGLAAASVAGTLYAIAAFYLVYFGVPYLWETYIVHDPAAPRFFEQAELLVMMLVGAVAFILLFPRLFKPQHGLRAGVAAGVAFTFLSFFAVYVVSWIVESLLTWLMPNLGEARLYVGGGVALVLLAVLLSWGWRKLQTERAHALLLEVEDQGWFSLHTYKKGQGLKARRGTMLGILLIVGSGIWVYGWKGGTEGGLPWDVGLPFVDPSWVLEITRAPRIMVPLAIGVFFLWFAYRLINYPRFADFLIATEAEMNKVSWASQKKLLQDTIVVLVVVLLMAAFLFIVDLLWSFLLTKINVLHQ